MATTKKRRPFQIVDSSSSAENLSARGQPGATSPLTLAEEKALDAGAYALVGSKTLAKLGTPFADELAQALGAPTAAALSAGVALASEPVDLSVSHFSVAIESLRESKTNPRQTFGDLPALAKSIEKVGVLQPLIVRELAGVMGFEVVAGHRRLRAAILAKLAEVPVVLRKLTDAQVVELQLVENLRRLDLNPMEEAEGFDGMRKLGLSVEQIAARLDMPKGSVYGRLKLLELCAEARAMLLDGKLHPSVATPLARLSPRLQVKALENQYLRPHEGTPAPARAAIEWLQREFVRSLRGAPFDLKDETLCPEAGACSSCPKRTKTAPELFDDLRKLGDSCTDPACFDEKAKATWKAKAAAAQAAGDKVLPAKEGAELFRYGHLTDSKLVELDAPNHADPKRRTWRELLEKVKEGAPEKIVTSDADFKVHELVDRKAAVKALAGAGVKWAEQEAEVKAKRSTDKAKATEDEELEALRRRVLADMLLIAAKGVAKAIDLTPGIRTVLELVLAPQLGTLDVEVFETIAGWKEGAAEELDDRGLEKLPPAKLLEVLCLSTLEELEGFGEYSAPAKRLAKAFGLELKTLEKSRRELEAKATEKEQADKLFKKHAPTLAAKGGAK